MKPINPDEIIVGRVEPHIYAFSTNTVPNYLKVGDTYRPVTTRLAEWRSFFPDLTKQYDKSACISNKIFFRDHAVHKYLENNLQRKRLSQEKFHEFVPHVKYCKEFFESASANDIDEAVSAIKESVQKGTQEYLVYNTEDKLPAEIQYERGAEWPLRPNQSDTVERFINAVNKGRHNLLMYAVMRFGKSFTALCCAKQMKAKIVLVTSAKADVKEEWRKNVQQPGNFNNFIFVDSEKLKRDETVVKSNVAAGKTVIMFATLQDLKGDEIKEKHKEIFKNKIDLLIIDETHYGARAQEYGKVLQTSTLKRTKTDNEDYIDPDEAEEQIKQLNANVKLHLSGTPYRILMGSEFEEDDIIAFYQFTDIVHDQQNWDKNHQQDILFGDGTIQEWDNPYYGFPKMLRFAFHPSRRAKQKLEQLKKNGSSYAFSELFRTKSISRSDEGLHKLFNNEAEILELFRVIDGSQNDENVLGFLNNDKIMAGNMCRHIVCVLPYKASCDALEKMIHDHRNKFINLKEYEIVNISGVDTPNKYPTIKSVQSKIKECEAANKKTLTLTVNRMLTGSTVPEWDTMIFLKDTASPQEYDQAIFRIQNQYIKTLKNADGETIKFNMKPQTVLVDFDLCRMFSMQETKSLIYNINIDENGNQHLENRIKEELDISPIIYLNHNQIHEVEAIDIIKAVSEYSSQRGVIDEVKDIPVDMDLFNNDIILEVIQQQGELGSKQGLKIDAHDGAENEIDVEDPEDTKNVRQPDNNNDPQEGNEQEEQLKRLANKLRTYYSRILFFTFLSRNDLRSLDEIISVIDQSDDNMRIASHLGLDKDILKLIKDNIRPLVLHALDNKIMHIQELSMDNTLRPIERAQTAIVKFGKFSESEIITPLNICREMISALPDSVFFALKESGHAILDIASKSGEFAIAVCEKCKDLNISVEEIKDSVLSIPTSEIAYEFTRKIYEILGLSINNIASNFTSYDLLSVKITSNQREEIDYTKITNILTQNKPMSEIVLTDIVEEIGEAKMHFEAIVGNPPYDIIDGGGTGSSAKPIYDKFVCLARQISPCYTTLIIPSRWMTGGKGLNNFRLSMLEDQHIRILHDYLDSKECFGKVAIEGGVCYMLWDRDNVGICDFYSHSNGQIIRSQRLLADMGGDVIVRDSRALSIIQKTHSDFTFNSLVFPRNLFKIDNQSIITESPFAKAFKVLGRFNSKRQTRFLRSYKSNDLRANQFLGAWKVFISKADGAAGQLGNPVPARIIGKAELGDPYTLCTETFLAIGPFETRGNAQNVIKYMATKFFRFLVGARKLKNMTQDTYSFVPLLDFSTNKDINWDRPIEDIDKQLYKKYNLTNAEIDFIESMIKPMN